MKMVLSHTSSLTPATCLIDPKDYPLVSRFKWKAYKVSPHNRSPYAATWLSGRPLYMHRLIMNPLPGLVIDHVNGNGLDNRRKNLRICSRSNNLQNTTGWATRKCEYKGVSATSRSKTARPGTPIWEARICWGGKQRVIGLFDLPELAALAYDDWARYFHGEYAYLNFPDFRTRS